MTTDPLIEKYGTQREGHAIFAPSAAATWLSCSGGLLVNARAGDTAGFDAAQGTVAHRVAEVWNRYGERPDHLIGLNITEWAGGNAHVIPVTEEMLHHVGRFVEWCRELPGDHYYEQRVDLSELMPIPGQRGTADHFVCQPRVLTITDLKYGTGVRVYAERNPQAMLYACGAFLEWDWIYGFERIIIRICQPRLDVFEVWECSRKELLDFMEYVKVRARAAWDENAPRTPSKKACRFCAGEATCSARLNELNDIIDATFETDDDAISDEPKTYTADELQNPSAALAKLAGAVDRAADTSIPDLSTRQLAFLLSRRKPIERLFKAVAEILLDRAERGQEIPWFHLTDGRNKRVWKDEQQAIGYIKDRYAVDDDDIAPPRLLTPAKLEKLLPAKAKRKSKEVKDDLATLINTFAGKRTLALLDEDERPDADELIDDMETED